jgi:putative spermidine/putrescine transport system ATP-binding protein
MHRPTSLPISIRRVRKTYGEIAALDDLSLDIASGEFMTLLGPSGSGKTTLLMVLAGFIRPDAGDTRFGERDVSLVPPHKRDVGMVFQNYALFPHMTVAGNVAYPLKLRGLSRSAIAERVARVLALVQLQGLEDRYADQLSGGQRQRVALARAIVFEPRILLMDEPLAALDKKLREQMQIEVRRLHRALGMTTLYVTHDQREALTMSDRVAVIDQGRLQQVGRPRDIYEQPGSRFIAQFIGDSHFIGVTVAANGASFAGRSLRLAHAPQSAGGRHLLVLRPEKLRLLDGGDGDGDGDGLNVFEGLVKELVYQGESWLLYVTLATGEEIAVRRATSEATPTPPRVGSQVRLGLLPADSVVVPADTSS